MTGARAMQNMSAAPASSFPYLPNGPDVRTSVIAGLALLSFVAQADGVARTVTLTGYATDRVTGAPLYSETHRQTFQGDVLVSHHTEYRDPDGTLFATKHLDYRTLPFAPTFRLDDLRNGYHEGAQYADGKYLLYRGTKSDAHEDVADVAPGPDLVADSGFDRYIEAHLSDLLERKQLHLRLAVAGKLTTVRFRVDTLRIDDAHEIELRAEPDSLLSFFVAPIHLTYDADSGRLIRYVGISNIRSPSGELYDARIDFPPAGTSEPGFTASH